MVRIKERYLLVKILYPNELGSRPGIPDVVVLNQPTTDQLNSAALLRGLRAEVASLFGDYGSGAIEGGNLSVKYFSPATSTLILRTTRSSYRISTLAAPCGKLRKKPFVELGTSFSRLRTKAKKILAILLATYSGNLNDCNENVQWQIH
ncbi:Rpp14/Pop5 family-domain-containing protein [Hypoxylon rubiginosum]|uniref:Rpp14/Pop5 family-domain-containing protein n=1 Tax=Hypoxylon rubiginosum TaxID=110542 RepID=A0ACB9Z6A3_9PEZI|nr:Rpp14/Pop5 family-domain-containing protein [Hypoxylon rubiginosum]